MTGDVGTVLVSGRDRLIVQDDADIVVFDIGAWRPVSRTRVGASLAARIATWNDVPEDPDAAGVRAAIAARLGSASPVALALVPLDDAAAALHSRRMDRAREFARWSESSLPLPGWHRLGLAKRALSLQEHVAWGVPGARAAFPHLDLTEVPADRMLRIRPGAVHLIDDLRVDPRLRADFESEASSRGASRLYFGDDGDVLRIGPSVRARGVTVPAPRPGIPVALAPLAVALLERELLLADERIAGGLTGDASISLGKVFSLSWRTLAASEERLPRPDGAARPPG